MQDFERLIRRNFRLDSSYANVKVSCSWYPIDRETPEVIETMRTTGFKYGNYYDTDWKPGNTTIKGRFIPKK